MAQSGAVYETYKTKSGNTNESDGTIFNKPFQEFNYIKTKRGIEVYQTYKNASGNGTNQSYGTIFSKPFPEYYIIGNNIYKTYKTDYKSTNESNGTMFSKPFQSKEIKAQALKENIKIQVKTQTSYSKNNGPTYDGETYNSGGEE
jgi:hypothetical protein